MTTKKAHYGLLGLLILIIIAIGLAMYFSRVFLKTNSDKLVNAKLELYKIDETEYIYRKNQAILQENKETADILSSVLPQEKDQAKAVREITQIAGANGLSVKSIKFPGSDLVITNKPATTTQPQGSTTTPAPAAPAGPTISQAKPVSGLSNVLGIAVEIELTSSRAGAQISTDQVLSFLQQVENNRRNIRVTSINFGSSVDEGKTLKIDTILFIKP